MKINDSPSKKSSSVKQLYIFTATTCQPTPKNPPSSYHIVPCRSATWTTNMIPLQQFLSRNSIYD